MTRQQAVKSPPGEGTQRSLECVSLHDWLTRSQTKTTHRARYRKKTKQFQQFYQTKTAKRLSRCSHTLQETLPLKMTRLHWDRIYLPALPLLLFFLSHLKYSFSLEPYTSLYSLVRRRKQKVWNGRETPSVLREHTQFWIGFGLCGQR